MAGPIVTRRDPEEFASNESVKVDPEKPWLCQKLFPARVRVPMPLRLENATSSADTLPAMFSVARRLKKPPAEWRAAPLVRVPSIMEKFDAVPTETTPPMVGVAAVSVPEAMLMVPALTSEAGEKMGAWPNPPMVSTPELEIAGFPVIVPVAWMVVVPARLN